MRKLASIQEVKWVSPIQNYDRIELVGILGYQIICKKGEYKVGDKTIYVEIDSLLPEKEEFEFLRSKKFKIKTMKLRGFISQGICFPLSLLPSEVNYKEGDDVTSVLGVTQYNKEDEKIEERISKNKNPVFGFFCKFKWFRKIFVKKDPTDFPDWIQKTDETRYQNILHLNSIPNCYEKTEKIEGTSSTYGLKIKKGFFKKNDFAVCSRNRRIREGKYTKQTNSQFSNDVYWRMAKKYKIESVLNDLAKVFGVKDSIIIQGETIGPGIQKNIYELTEHKLLVYNLIIDGKTFSSVKNREIIERYNMEHVPILESNYRIKDFDKMQDEATGMSVLKPKVLREGVVFRTFVSSCIEWNKLFSFKAVSNEYLLKSKIDE